MLIGLNVENTREAIYELEEKGYPFIPNPLPISDDKSGKARLFRDREFAFIHLKKTNGMLM